MYDLLSADIGEKKYGNVIAEVAFLPSGFVEYAYTPHIALRREKTPVTKGDRESKSPAHNQHFAYFRKSPGL